MNSRELAKVVEGARCKIIGWEDAGNNGHRRTLAMLIQAFNNTESALLCEPSLARRTRRPPDIVVIDPEVGAHVIEVKSVDLDRIESLEAGGLLRIRYPTNIKPINPIAQVRSAMFDIRDATVQSFGGDIRLPFSYWVAFPMIRRAAWLARFGESGFCAPEYLFAEAIEPSLLMRRFGASDRERMVGPIKVCPLEQLGFVWRAFGDTSVLYCSPGSREPRQTRDGTLGKQFDEAADRYKVLSDEQQRLSVMNWDGGPRQIRGVAGSGKTIVLANNLARNLERRLIAGSEDLFGNTKPPPKLLAVCYNRTLAPFIQRKINIAFEQRNGRPAPEGTVEVCTFNQLMWSLAEAGLWRYQNVTNVQDIARAIQYWTELEQIKQRNPKRLQTLGYDAIYVDEGQDLLEEEFRLLKDLCRNTEAGEPNLYVFYDDAQNLYGRKRPNWQSLGINVRGLRSFVMTQCFRNTKSVLEAAFNVLYGTCADTSKQVPTRGFADIATLQEKGLIIDDGGFWRVRFAAREGAPPRISIVQSVQKENDAIIARLRELIGEQEIRPADIMVLAFHRDRVLSLASAIEAARIPGVSGVHVAFERKDEVLGQKGRLTLSTVASAKGYDAYCVLLASANNFTADVKGRASFYVGCTRAIEHLEVFAYEEAGLAKEMRKAIVKSASDNRESI